MLNTEFVKAVTKITQELKVPKSRENKFGGYKYRSCEDILDSVKPLLGNYLLYLSDSVETVGERIYIKATATLTDGENELSATGYAREALNKKGMDEAQVTGGASSYARKYALNGLFCIDDGRGDPDNPPEKPEKPEKPEQPEQPVTPEEPEQPEQPEEPETPVTPEQPVTPVAPVKPITFEASSPYGYILL